MVITDPETAHGHPASEIEAGAQSSSVIPAAHTEPGSRAAVSPVRVKVVSIDDDFVVRAGVRALLEKAGRLRVVGSAEDGDQALRQVAEHEPDVIIVDPATRGWEGSTSLQRIRSLCPRVCVVFLSMFKTPEEIRDAFAAGAAAYVAKDDQLADLPRIVAGAYTGDTYLSPRLSRSLLENYVQGGSESRSGAELTERQREVLALIAHGKSSRSIGEQLGITLRTVHTHRSRIMRKLDVHTEAGLVYAAMRMGLVRPE